MATYLELKAQAEKLMAEAENLRELETQQVIDDIKAKMQAYGITPRDLGLSSGPSGPGGSARRAARGAGREKVVKFRGPNGEAWSGGRGRKPDWVVRALKEGRSLDEFAV